MRETERAGEWGRKLVARLEKYKFILLIILVGIVLLVLPTSKKSTAQDGGEPVGTAVAEQISFDLTDMEERLSEALSKIDGAGEVRVLLTLQSGSRVILAQDTKTSESGDALEREISTVIVSKGANNEETIALQELAPKYQGAVVICPGGGNSAVRLKLTEAVSALTGLGADRISVCKGNT